MQKLVTPRCVGIYTCKRCIFVGRSLGSRGGLSRSVSNAAPAYLVALHTECLASKLSSSSRRSHRIISAHDLIFKHGERWDCFERSMKCFKT
jgi:dihydrodipicolinate synthase/N-acetylneuraminate lyase